MLLKKWEWTPRAGCFLGGEREAKGWELEKPLNVSTSEGHRLCFATAATSSQSPKQFICMTTLDPEARGVDLPDANGRAGAGKQVFFYFEALILLVLNHLCSEDLLDP